MELLKKYFPYSFGAQDLKGLIIKIVVLLVVNAVLGWVIGLIPFVGGILSWVVSVYCTIGWILAVLDYLKVLK